MNVYFIHLEKLKKIRYYPFHWGSRYEYILKLVNFLSTEQKYLVNLNNFFPNKKKIPPKNKTKYTYTYIYMRACV